MSIDSLTRTRVTIKTVADLGSAHVLKGALDAAGIEAFLPDENTAWIAWHLNQAIGGVRIQVDQNNAEAASRLLETQSERDAPASPPLTSDDDWTEADLMVNRAEKQWPLVF
jgi:hypothetical protein